MKLQNIQALRGLAVLSVVFFHLVIVEKKYGGSKTILPDIFEFGMFGVDLFFVISGFIMVAVTRGKFQDTKKGLRFLYHRISRIYPVYWVYTLLVLGVFLVNPSLVNSSQGNQVDIVASFLLLPSDKLPLVMVGWTLIHEMYFYLVFFLVLLLIPERRMLVAILLWGVGVIFLNIALELNNPYTRLIFHPLTLEFIAGCFLAKLYFSESEPRIRTRTWLILSLTGLLASLCGYEIYREATGLIEPPGWWRVLIFGVPAMLMVFCFVKLERSGFTMHSYLIKIGDASYSIYLSHVLTLSAAGRLWHVVSSDARYDNVIMVPVLIALTIVVGILSYTFIEKPLLRLTRRVA